MERVCYVDLGIVPIEGAEYISELTWVIESGLDLVAHHYFVDYPGAKDLERQIIEVVGGNTLTRYSCTTVLKTFIGEVSNVKVIAFKTEKQKQLFTAMLLSAGINAANLICTFDDILLASPSPENMLSVFSLIEDKLSQTKNAAAKIFGNSL